MLVFTLQICYINMLLNFCIHVSLGIVPFLVKASISLDEGVAPTLLQLLQCALCGSEVTKGPQPQGSASGTSPAKQKKAKDKDKDKDKNEGSAFISLICKKKICKY